VFRDLSRWLDQRLGLAKVGNKQLRKVFPDHWSFMLGEITLYCFVIILITGAYLTFFFEPSARDVVYHGSYKPLDGTEMSAAYQSALDISFKYRAGLVMRQMHHWAALLFLAAMVVHLMRTFFTGAYRRPRELNWIIGVNLLILAIFNGFLGYSLLDDLLSGTGVRVGYSILLSIPVVGPDLANLVFGGEFPSTSLIPRFFVLHVLLLPAAIVGLLSAHLGLVWFQKHTQFRGPGRTEKNVVGSRLFPVYMSKMGGLFFFTFAVIGALGGLAQINPIWVFGPFHGGQVAAAVSSASQPDWYMGWLDGVLRLIPGWETRIGGYELPNYFWGGVVMPGIVFTGMMVWPFLEPKWTKDRDAHNLLDRPRDAPFRAAFGSAVFSFMVVLLLAGSNDVLSTIFGMAPETITETFRVLVFLVPIATFFLVRKICNELNGTNIHPAAPGPNHVIVRTAEGGYTSAHDHEHEGNGYNSPDPNVTDAPPPTSKV
jgi:ubiquinol-cytochrome c reductase cytochrome b subunit